MPVPSIAALEIAAEWLDQYEGETSDEADDMRAVADWLRERARSKITNKAKTAAIRQIAQTRGVSPKLLRTACGKWALNEDGSRRLETDINADMVDCRNCLRAYRNATSAKKD